MNITHTVISWEFVYSQSICKFVPVYDNYHVFREKNFWFYVFINIDQKDISTEGFEELLNTVNYLYAI